MTTTMQTILKTQLHQLTSCPACATPRQEGTTFAAFECGACFTVSETLGAVVASQPCPMLSDYAAQKLTDHWLGGRAGSA